MPTYRVDARDRTTGNPVAYRIDAPTEQEARDHADKHAEVTRVSLMASPAPVASVAPVASPVYTPGPPSLAHGAQANPMSSMAPRYTGVKAVSIVALVWAIVMYLAGVFMMVEYMTLVWNRAYSGMPRGYYNTGPGSFSTGPNTFSTGEFVRIVAPALWVILGGVICHVASTGLNALRDIARSNYR